MIKKGDIVGRISYNKDIAFIVDRIIRTKNSKFAILKGVNIRIEADSPLSDLEIFSEKTLKKKINDAEKEFFERITSKNLNRQELHTGKILHLDGDRRYSQKSAKYYEKMRLNAIVRNIPENQQPKMVYNLLKRYNPDILVITGHDAMLKNGINYNNIYNYRNSRHFINSVQEARRWQRSSNKLAIFARSLSKLF